MFLLGADRSENTIRSYIPKVAKFLNWADFARVDWKSVTLPEMSRFKWSLEATPRPTQQDPRPTAVRGPKTVNLALTAVLEFLRFCARQGTIEASTVERLVEPRFISHVPPGFDPGERGQFRFKRRREIRAREVTSPPKTLTSEQVERIISATTNPRDRFLVILLEATGLRIGEALGLRRSDMHFLPDSTVLGCEVAGPHVHVIRRVDNDNGALAKSRPPRHVPVLDGVVTAYRDYQILRDGLDGQESDHVFVNVAGGVIGAAMTYNAAIGLTKRIGRRAAAEGLHPHLFRHTTATRWIDSGVTTDVVQRLLGHASPASTAIYTHPSADKLRAAVEKGAGHLSTAAQDSQPSSSEQP
jgi:integrase